MTASSCVLFILFNGFIWFASGNEVLKCSSACEENQKSIFKVGHTYVYDYKANAFSYINSTNSEHINVENSTIKLFAEIDLHVLSPCHLVMNIFNASLQDRVNGDSYENFTEYLTKNEVRITYNNGIIKELCFTKSDPVWVVNIKRGILSMLQFDLKNNSTSYTTTESNVLGICKSDYTVGYADGWKTLKRKRIYKDCVQWGGNEMFKSNTQQKYMEVLDLFKNSQVCRYVLGDIGQPVQVVCKERQKFHPHASKVNFAVSNVTQYLDLDRVIVKHWESNVDDEEFIYKNMPMEFSSREDTLNINSLKEFIDMSRDMYNPQLSKLIKSHNFGVLLRNTPFEEIIYGINVFKSNFQPLLSSYYNAILRTKTSETIKVVKLLHEKGIVDEYEFNLWLKSFAFMKYPNSQLLNDLKIFLNVKDAELAISGLVLNFCRNTPNCTEDSNVKYWVNYWDSTLKTHLTNFNQQKLTTTLLAIGNTGLTNYIPLIGSIITKTTHPPLLRMTAMEALRKMSCESKIKYFRETFTKWSDNAEVRIAAYMELCKCPSNDILHQILISFNVEGLNEVTTFIWNHFNKSKTLPQEWIENITHTMQDSFLKAEYMTYIPYHAEYFEHFTRFPILNATIEINNINIISNTLPWSSYIRLKMGLFGNDVDKVEIFGRVRDISGIIEFLNPRKNPTAEDNKYTSDESMSNNVIYTEDKLLEPFDNHRYLQSGNIVTRIFDIDINYENPYNMSYALLETIKKSMYLLKPLYTMHDTKFTNMSYEFPTSVGYKLKFHNSVYLSNQMTLLKFDCNTKATTSNFNISSAMHTTLLYSISISHDAHVTNVTKEQSIYLMPYLLVHAGATLEHNKVHKLSFDMNLLYDDRDKYQELLHKVYEK